LKPAFFFLEVKLLQIGSVTLENPYVLAPMAGVTSRAFRLLCKNEGAGLVVTEMVSAKALTYNSAETKRLLEIDPKERPIAAQLFGSEPDVLAQAAKICEQEFKPDIIDINMGCPAPKIVKNNEGSALLKDPKKAAKIAETVVKSVKIPVTCKIRLGWDKDSLVHVKLAKMLEDAGVSGLTVHGRTREDFYSGKANWQAITEVVEAVDIPVIGNGDIWQAEDALRMKEETGCKMVAVGRGAMGNPWIFRDILALEKGQSPKPVTLQERLEMARKHALLLISFSGEKIAMLEMRKNMAWYLKGQRQARLMRQQLNSLETFSDLEKIIEMMNSSL
jgi:tRNA-dihydrouridine synthase B